MTSGQQARHDGDKRYRSRKQSGVKNAGGVSRTNNSRRQNAILRGEEKPMEYTMTVEEAIAASGIRREKI